MTFDLVTVLTLVGLCAFSLAVLVNLRWLIMQVRRLTAPLLLLVAAWFLMFIAKVSFVDWRVRDYAVAGSGGIAAMDGSSFHQVLCAGGAAALICILLVWLRESPRALQRPEVLLLLAYGTIALISTTYSPAPGLTAFKASLVVIDAALVAAALTLLRGRKAAVTLLNCSYFVAYLFSAGALLGAILAPEVAFYSQYGALSEKRLQGVLPAMHPNEIGALGAIAAIIGLVRAFGSARGGTRRSYWAAQFAVGSIVVFLAQARTSLIGLVLGAALAAVSIPRLRRYVGISIAVMAAAALVSAVHSGSVDWSKGPVEMVTAYMQRGEEISNLSDVSDFHGRMEDWRGGFRMILESPVMGHGYDAGVRELGRDYGIPDSHMHNAHLQVLVNTGIAGYLPWVALVLLTSWLTFLPIVMPSRHTTEERRIEAVETAAVMIALLITTMTFSELAAHTQTLMLMLGVLIYQRVVQLETAPRTMRHAIGARRYAYRTVPRSALLGDRHDEPAGGLP